MEEKELMAREWWQMGPPAQADDDNRGVRQAVAGPIFMLR
jgi:hypothetical protein